MARKFSVNEIVIFVPDGKGDHDLHKYTGEVEIVLIDDLFDEYRVQAPDGHCFWAVERVLRKRPQPPDWNKLSTPTEKPVEVIA